MSSMSVVAAMPLVKFSSVAAVRGSCDSLAVVPAYSAIFHVPTTCVSRKVSPMMDYKEQNLVFSGKFTDRNRSEKMDSVRCFSALTPEFKTSLDKVVASHKVLLFMKGTKDFPQCGFSNTVVQILNSLNVPFETINILENELLRQAMKEYSSWPTFPQLYVDNEFFGGCDIVVESYQSGELQELLEKAMCS